MLKHTKVGDFVNVDQHIISRPKIGYYVALNKFEKNYYIRSPEVH